MLTEFAQTETAECEKLRILLVIASLEGGGTERQVVLLASGLIRTGHDVQILVKRRGGQFFDEALAEGVVIRHMTGSLIKRSLAIRRLVKSQRIPLVYGFLPESNIILALLRILGCRAVLVHGVRSSKFELSPFPARTRIAYRLSSLCSLLADGVVFNSRAGAESYKLIRRLARNWTIIPNGFDTQRFRPDDQAAKSFRIQHQVGSDTPVAAFVGRVDPLKGLEVLFAAMNLLQESGSDLLLFVFGSKSDSEVSKLREEIDELGLSMRVKVEKFSREPEKIFQAVDLVILPSLSEGFPNVLVEALLCGASIAATDVGDNQWILGGKVPLAAPNDAESLASVIAASLSTRLDPSIQVSIGSRFSAHSMVRDTENYLRCLIPARFHVRD